METTSTTNDLERAFRGIRYIASDGVRLARAALDVGSTGPELVRIFTRHIAKDLPQVAKDNIKRAIPMASQFMVENPDAGAVVWLENGRWDWADEHEKNLHATSVKH